MDGVRMAILNKRFEAVCRKMANTLFRTGRSGVLNTARDFSCCIVTADCALLATAESLPIHVLSGPDLMAASMKEFHPALRRGDAFLHNSPYHGCSHPADHTILVPVIDEGGTHRFTLIAKAHQADCGNSIATTYHGAARDVYEEGALIFPAVQVQRDYETIDDIVRMCRMRIRVPDQWWGDFLAMLGAARVGERELLALAAEVGWETLEGFATEWFDYSEKRMIDALAGLPAGSLTVASAHDPVPGAPEGVRVNVSVRVDPAAARIEVDLRDNVDSLPFGLNMSEACARTSAMVGIFNALPHTVPPNAGAFRRIEVKLRQGCVVGIPEHPTSCSVATTNVADHIANGVQRAIAELGDGHGMAEVGGVIPPSCGVISRHGPAQRRALRQPDLPRLRRRRRGAGDRCLDHHRPCRQRRPLLPGFHRGRRDGLSHQREGAPLHHRQRRRRAPARRGRRLRRVRPGRGLPFGGGLRQQRRGQPGQGRARRRPRRMRAPVPARQQRRAGGARCLRPGEGRAGRDHGLGIRRRRGLRGARGPRAGARRPRRARALGLGRGGARDLPRRPRCGRPRRRGSHPQAQGRRAGGGRTPGAGRCGVTRARRPGADTTNGTGRGEGPLSGPHEAVGVRTIHAGHQHMTWDNAREPAATVAPGETIAFEEIDAVCGQIAPDSTPEAIANLDFDRVNPIAGPIYVDGAEPGDTIKATLLDLAPSGWAWTAIVPGFGLLADDFPEPALNIWSYDGSFREPAAYATIARVPLKPFCGTIGLARAEPGAFSTVPPYESGGNIDIRDLTIGVDLYLPVQVPGGLFSIGDPHCAQGDGEVCGTAIESPMAPTVRLDLIKGENLRFPPLRDAGAGLAPSRRQGLRSDDGNRPDLMEAAQNAVRGMIDRLGASRGLAAADSYMLCSVCADLRISEIVDRPNWVVSCYLPRIVFE